MNQPKETAAFLHNGNSSEATLQALLTGQQVVPEKVGDYDLSMETRLAFIERGIKNGVVDGGGDGDYNKWDQINMNVTKLPTDNMVQLDEADRTIGGNNNNDGERFFNGNRRSQGPRAASAGVTACSGGSGDTSLSRSTEELSPEKRAGRPPLVAKCNSVSNMEPGVGMRLYAFDGDHPDNLYGGGPVVSVGAGSQPPIVRSKSASQLLSEQSLQVCPGSSASSSDLLSSTTKAPTRYPTSSAVPPSIAPPQYNIQYTSAALPKDGYWAHRVTTAPSSEHQSYLPPPPPHSLANTNYSNRNQAPPAYPLHPPAQPWGAQPRSSTLQRQSSAASNASTSDYLTYRDIHTLARGPLAMSHAAHRPLSARTYSMDAPPGSGGGRTLGGAAARLQPHELPERTMSVSDFNYQHGSPSKKPNARVKSEHSLLDGSGLMAGGGASGRVPADWRDQVMRHIEAKKMEKVN